MENFLKQEALAPTHFYSGPDDLLDIINIQLSS